jgi:hypothetical protein
MFELALIHLNQPDRERDLDADIRRRQLLRAARGASMADPAPTRSSGAPRQASRVQATER